jgi:hypothetical protein
MLRAGLGIWAGLRSQDSQMSRFICSSSFSIPGPVPTFVLSEHHRYIIQEE